MAVLSNLKEPNHCVLAKAILLGELGDPNPENTVEALHHMGLMCGATHSPVWFRLVRLSLMERIAANWKVLQCR